jgi:Na+/H+ antiporter NhaC
VEPHDHVRTQIPYALITAVAAVGLGFLPAATGVSAVACLVAGSVGLLLLPYFSNRISRVKAGDLEAS